MARAAATTDSTAVGAAGALPFFSGLPNVDLFGLNDLEIARHGRVIGNRPGHQRFAQMDYLMAQKPTFVFMSPEATPLEPGRLRYDRYWTSHGYVPIEIRVDRELCDCPETFYHQFLVRRERADALRGRADARGGRSLALTRGRVKAQLQLATVRARDLDLHFMRSPPRNCVVDS